MNLALIIGAIAAYFLYQKQQTENAAATTDTTRPIPEGPTGIMTRDVEIGPQEIVQTGVAVGPSSIGVPPTRPPITGPTGIMTRAEDVPLYVLNEPKAPVDPVQSSAVSATGESVRPDPVFQPMIQPPAAVNLPSLAEVRQRLSQITYMDSLYGTVTTRNGEVWDTPTDFNLLLMSMMSPYLPGRGGDWVPSIAQLWPDKAGMTGAGAVIPFSEYWSKVAPWLQSHLGMSGLGAIRTHGGWAA